MIGSLHAIISLGHTMIKAYPTQFFIVLRSCLEESSQGFIHPVYHNWDMDHVDEYLVAIKNSSAEISKADTDRFEYTYDLQKDKYAIASEKEVITPVPWLQTDGNGHFWHTGEFEIATPWDENAWSILYSYANRKNDRELRYAILRDVFTNTRTLSDLGGYKLGETFIKLEKPDAAIVYNSPIKLPTIPERNKRPSVQVLNEDCLVTAKRLEDLNPLVLNMANRSTPGGGVLRGCAAQEECLFRQSNYFQSLYPVFKEYPLNRDCGGAYSKGVTVFRDSAKYGYKLLENTFKTNFVAVAALRNPMLYGNGHLESTEYRITKRRLQTIFDIAIINGHRTLILGAIGCGAFHNPPHDIAQIFKELIEAKPYSDYFEQIFFSIIGDHNDPIGKNYASFKEVFES